MVLKIYGHPLSTYTQKALIALAATDTPYDFVFVDLLKGEHKGSDYTAKDPFGSVPCLVRLACEIYGFSRANSGSAGRRRIHSLRVARNRALRRCARQFAAPPARRWTRGRSL
jgi:hypothetical protein